MKVKELIELLKEYPEDIEVLIRTPEYWEGDTEEDEPDLWLDERSKYNCLMLN